MISSFERGERNTESLDLQALDLEELQGLLSRGDMIFAGMPRFGCASENDSPSHRALRVLGCANHRGPSLEGGWSIVAGIYHRFDKLALDDARGPGQNYKTPFRFGHQSFSLS